MSNKAVGLLCLGEEEEKEEGGGCKEAQTRKCACRSVDEALRGEVSKNSPTVRLLNYVMH